MPFDWDARGRCSVHGNRQYGERLMFVRLEINRMKRLSRDVALRPRDGPRSLI
jgi:hypothetical protein